MKFQLTIDSENAAFSGPDGANEVARLLRQTADKVEAGADCGPLMDYNGNRCGVWDAEPSEEYRCNDCGTLAGANDDGTTCRDCGRGIIEEGY